MNEAWLSETSVPGATTAILLGPIPEETIREECLSYPKGSPLDRSDRNRVRNDRRIAYFGHCPLH